MDLHNYRGRLEKTIQNIKESDISQENKKLLLEFYNNCLTESLSFSKIERYLYEMHRVTKMLNMGLLEAQKEDIKRVVAEIELKEWSPHSKHAFKVAIRKFYKSIEGPEEKGVYPERIRWLHSNVKNNRLKSPDELITEQEVKKMISASMNLRDKAFISVLYESGARIGEIGGIMFKDVVFDQYGAIVGISGKTGPRKVRLVTSAPYLENYINCHEHNDDPSCVIWTTIGENKRSLNYSRLSELIKRAAKRAGIKKRIHPHLFRHSRATFLAKKLTEAQMKIYLGWTQSSKMASVYVHMSCRDVDDSILALNGIKSVEQENTVEELKPSKCIKCKTLNEATAKFCKSCGLILNEEEANKIIKQELEREKADQLMNQLVKDPEILELIKKKLVS